MISDPALAPRPIRGRISGPYLSVAQTGGRGLMCHDTALAWGVVGRTALVTTGPGWVERRDVARRTPPKLSS